MITKIEVLNEGFARLVSYMQPVPEYESMDIGESRIRRIGSLDNWTGDLEVIRNARVSFDADWRTNVVEHEKICVSLLPAMSNGEYRPCNCTPRVVDDAKLIAYLYSHLHTSPFEAMVFTFEVKAPIFVFRQWHRHRTWSYNELSGRYGELSREYWWPHPDEIGEQDPKNKQARNYRMTEDYEERDRRDRLSQGFAIEAEHAFERYGARLGEGVPREVARANLPLSTYSRMFGTVNLHNLFKFISLRDHPHAQKEIQVYARALLELVRPICPLSVLAFERFKPMMVDTQERRDVPMASQSLVGAPAQDGPAGSVASLQGPDIQS